MTTTVTTVLFDLDGTLLDTAPDLVNAVNRVLLDEGCPALPLERLRPYVSGGAGVLLRQAFGEEQEAEIYQDRLRRMLDFYRNHIAEGSRLFAGMAAVLETLENQGLPWGVVTNKPGWLTEPLLQAMGLAQRSGCIVSGDTVAEKKPHPLPMLEACRRIGAEARSCVYVGDDLRDIQAGRAAGMQTLAAAYGYIAAGDDPRAWGADGLINAPEELLVWLEHQEVCA